MENFDVFLEKIKKLDDLHTSHLDSAGQIFSTTYITKPKKSPLDLRFSERKTRDFEKFSILEKIRQKDESFLRVYSGFLRNFSAIDSQYMRIYEKFLNSIFRNGSYQNCIKELIKMYNELIDEFNNFVNEFDVLIRIKTYEDLELMPDDYLNYYEEKLEVYLRNLREVKLQRNSKYLKMVKKRNLDKKSVIFADNREFGEKFLGKTKISLNEILKEFDKIYSGDDHLDESMVESLISQKVENESFELKQIFFHDISRDFAEDLEQQYQDFEVFLDKVLNKSNFEKSFREETRNSCLRNGRNSAISQRSARKNVKEEELVESFLKSQRNIKRNLFNEYFRNERKSAKNERKIDFPLQIRGISGEETLNQTKSRSFYQEKSMKNQDFAKNTEFNGDDLTYSKSFCNKIRRNPADSFQNISFQNSLKDSKENINSNLLEDQQDLNIKQRRNRSERLKYSQKSYKI